MTLKIFGALSPSFSPISSQCCEVVAHVVAAEGQHRHRVTADHAYSAGSGRGGFRSHDGAYEHAVVPVAGLIHQRSGLCAAAAEDDCGDRHALRIVKLGADAGAVLGGSGEAAVGMRALVSRTSVPFQGLPFQSTAFSGGFLSRPSHHTVLSSRLCTTLVKMVPFLVEASALGLDFSLVPGATPKKPFSGLMAYRRPSGPCAHPGDVVADGPDLIALLAYILPAGSAWPGWSCRRRTGTQRQIYFTSPCGILNAEDQHMLSHPALVACPGRKQCGAQSTSCPAARFRRSRS